MNDEQRIDGLLGRVAAQEVSALREQGATGDGWTVHDWAAYLHGLLTELTKSRAVSREIQTRSTVNIFTELVARCHLGAHQFVRIWEQEMGREFDKDPDGEAEDAPAEDTRPWVAYVTVRALASSASKDLPPIRLENYGQALELAEEVASKGVWLPHATGEEEMLDFYPAHSVLRVRIVPATVESAPEGSRLVDRIHPSDMS